jgi:hypothetical protein
MHKLVTHDYFMDEMHIIDINIMTKYIEFSDVLEWGHTRQLMLCQLKPYLKNKELTAAELLPLPTDDDGTEHTTEIANEDVEWYKNFVENYKKGNN